MRTLRNAALLVAIALLPLRAAITEPVRTDNGLVSGVAGELPGVRVFKGIPFAAPPVGSLRWHAPMPPTSWTGVRTADKFSDNCMQRAPGGGAFPPHGGDRSATTMSEDCLYLSVYTAANSSTDRRPVMVWIHGGALTSGAGAIYEGEELARKGVVVVTVNYRLGAFGFLAHPELTKESEHHSSGNYGFLDQVAALQWVQKNIAAFDGDPSRVTIFGESAGSWSVNYLTATPLAKGLFQRAIGESGGEFAPGRSLADAEAAGVEFAKSLGADSLATLRAKPAAEVGEGRFQTGANVDGWFLPEDVHTIYSQGKQNDVPMLIGSNADEGTIFTRDTTGDAFREQSRRRYGQDTDAFLKLYPFTSDAEATAAAAASMRDYTFGWEMRTWARQQRATGKSNAYLYFFSRVPPGPTAARVGAQHGAEIPYVFNWVNGRYSSGTTPWEAADRKLAEQMSSYWVNFATTGDPNGNGLTTWPVYDPEADQAMLLGNTVGVGPLPHKAALDFLDGYFNRLRSSSTASGQ